MEIGDTVAVDADTVAEWRIGEVATIDSHEETVISWFTGNGFKKFLITMSFERHIDERIADMHVYRFNESAMTLTKLVDDALIDNIDVLGLTCEW